MDTGDFPGDGSVIKLDSGDTGLALHNFVNLLKSIQLYWRRKWQPTPVFFPGESQGRGSLVGCRLWGRTESYTTEVT